jgi:predicted membrane GTPase involved in stress response
MTPLFQMIVDRVPPPAVDRGRPVPDANFGAGLFNSYVGVIGIGRIKPRQNQARLTSENYQHRRQGTLKANCCK